MFGMEKIQMPKKDHVGKRELEIEDGMINSVWPDLFAVGVPVTFEESVKEINGVKTIIYKVTLTCAESQWIELRVRLGIKGYSTPANDKVKKE